VDLRSERADDELVDVENDHYHRRQQGQRHAEGTVSAVVGRIQVADPEDNSADNEQRHNDGNEGHLRRAEPSAECQLRHHAHDELLYRVLQHANVNLSHVKQAVGGRPPRYAPPRPASGVTTCDMS